MFYEESNVHSFLIDFFKGRKYTPAKQDLSTFALQDGEKYFVKLYGSYTTEKLPWAASEYTEYALLSPPVPAVILARIWGVVLCSGVVVCPGILLYHALSVGRYDSVL